jgi:hypothetical protein
MRQMGRMTYRSTHIKLHEAGLVGGEPVDRKETLDEVRC